MRSHIAIGIVAGLAIIVCYLLWDTKQTNIIDRTVIDYSVRDADAVLKTPDGDLVYLGNYIIQNSEVFFISDEYGTGPVDGVVDIATFEVLPFGFAKDANHVYYGRSVMQSVDPAGFEVLSDTYARSDLYVWKYATGSNWSHELGPRDGIRGVLLDGVDPTSFRIVDEYDRYVADKAHVYYLTWEGALKVEDADPITFEMLDGSGAYYSRDADNLFFLNQVVIGADPNSVEFVQDAHLSIGAPPYVRDKSGVYYQGRRIEGVDPETFAPLNTTGRGVFMRDAKHVIRGGEIVEGLDPDSFEIMHEAVKDADSVYIINAYDLVELEDADPATFEHLGVCRAVEKSSTSYYRDKNSVYVGDSVVDVDAATFEYVKLHTFGELYQAIAYARDTKHVYEGCGTVIEDADPDTFDFEVNHYLVRMGITE